MKYVLYILFAVTLIFGTLPAALAAIFSPAFLGAELGMAVTVASSGSVITAFIINVLAFPVVSYLFKG